MHRGNSIVPNSWTIDANAKRTTFANQKAKMAYKAGGEGRNSLVFMPGIAHEDHREFVNVAFAAADPITLAPDYDMPIARFDVVHNNGLPTLEHTFYDDFANAVQTVDDAIKNHGYKRGLEQVATANIVNSTTIDATKSLNILDRVLGLQTRSYLLEMTVTKIPSPQLVFTVDEYTEGAVQAKVPELETPDLQSHTETRTTKTLYKNVGHIAESEEAMMKASHNTMSLRENWTIRDLARLLNSQISTELETATDVSGSDWGAKDATYGFSTNNPADDINTVVTTIEGNGFDVDFIAAHTRPAMDFVTNKWIRGDGSIGAAPPGVSAPIWGQKVFNVVGFPTVIADQAKTNTVATVGSKDAVWLGVGPTAIANYENVVAGYKGKVIKQWFFPYLSQAGAIRDLTGVSA